MIYGARRLEPQPPTPTRTPNPNQGPRVASLRASTEASVWALHRQVFQKTVQRQSQSGRQEIHCP